MQQFGRPLYSVQVLVTHHLPLVARRVRQVLWQTRAPTVVGMTTQMCGCKSFPPIVVSPEEKERNAILTRELRDWQKHDESRMVLLLMGPSNAGKSAFRRQLSCVVGVDFKEAE